MPDPLRLALQVSAHQGKLELLEIAVEGMLVKRFERMYKLHRGVFENGFNTFELKDTSDKTTVIKFHGPHAHEIRVAALGYFQTGKHKVKKLSGDLSLELALKRIAPAAKEELLKRQQKKVDKTTVLRLTPTEIAKGTPGYPQALDLLRDIHGANLLLGCPTKERFRFLDRNELAAEYEYANEDEALEAMKACEELFGSFIPSVADENGRCILLYSLSGLKNASVQRRCKIRRVNKRSLAYDDKMSLLRFIAHKLCSLSHGEIVASSTGGHALVRLRNEFERAKLIRELRTLCFASLASEKDPRCMWVALSESSTWVFEDPKLPPTEIIRILESGGDITQESAKATSYNQADGLSLVRGIMTRVFGWRFGKDYGYNYRVVRPEPDRPEILQYSAISLLQDHDDAKLTLMKARYRQIVKELPPGVTAVFVLPGSNKPAKALHFYFVDRLSLAAKKKTREKIAPVVEAMETKQVQQDPMPTPGLRVFQTLLEDMDPAERRACLRLLEEKERVQS